MYAVIIPFICSGNLSLAIQIVIYCTARCPLCENTKTLLTKWGMEYEEKRVDLDNEALNKMLEISYGARTVPQITVKGQWIGGLLELSRMYKEGKLNDL